MNTFSLDQDTIFLNNPDRGSILLFHQNFTEMDQAPKNVFLGPPTASGDYGRIYRFFWGEQKSLLGHNKEKGIVFTTRRIRVFPWLRTLHGLSLIHI